MGLKVIRAAFRIGEKLSPELAGRVAFELFARTPDPRRQTEGERRAIARADAFMQTARHHRVAVGRDCVCVHEFRPENSAREAGRVLVLHGWRSRTEFMMGIIEGLRAAGFRVFSIDLPGHGRSGGRRLTMMKAVEAVGQVDQWFGPFAAVVAHSFGGAVAANATAGSPDAVPPMRAARLVLIAAPDSISNIIDGFSNQLGIGERSRAAMAGRIERLAGRRLQDFDGSRLVARSRLPTLVIHAPDDREVPAKEARSYAAAGEHVQLQWADGLGHRRILSDASVVSQIVTFVSSPAPLALAG
jgi:pimeloyl-ACP methyl ester carboxylesterase